MRNNIESKLMDAAKRQVADPPAFVWDNIENEIHREKSKNKLAFWWIGSGLVAIILITLYTMLGEDQISNINNKLITQSTAKNTTDNKSTSTYEIEITDEIKDLEKKPHHSSSNLTQNNSLSIHQKNKLSDQPKSRTQVNNTSGSISYSETNDNSLITINASENYLSEATTLNTIESNSNSIKEITNDKKRLNLLFNSIASLGPQKLNYERLAIINSDSISYNIRSKSNLYMEFGIIGGLHNISLSNSDNNKLYDQRKSTESSWYSTGLYTSIGMKLSENWHISIGAEWIMSKDRFESVSPDIIKLIDNRFVTGNLYNKADNTFHFIDVPVSVGYTISNDKWMYGAELSGLVNIRSFAEGKIFDSSAEISTIESDDPIYKSSVGIGLRPSLLIARRLDNRLSLQVRPSFKTYLNAINSEDYPIASKYSLYSVSIGMKKEF